MTTIAEAAAPRIGRDDGFFVVGAFVMTAVLVIGFSVQLAVGRSSFSSPPLLHAHAIVFMGWMVINLLQTLLATSGRLALHRRLGWLATVWMVPMLVLGCAVTLAIVRRGGVPFFFRPLQFLIFDPVSLLAFVGLTVWAIVLRRQTDWHRRLHFCAMSILLGPGFGRLLPGPLLMPWAWEAVVVACLLFPVAGMVSDLRRSGRVHPAWTWGVGAILVAVVVTEAITYSPVGTTIYRAAVTGSPAAAIPPLDFPTPPGPPPAS